MGYKASRERKSGDKEAESASRDPSREEENTREEQHEETERVAPLVDARRSTSVDAANDTPEDADIERVDSASANTVSHAAGPDHEALTQRYEMPVGEREATTIHRLESEHGSDQVQRWADEGMPVGTMSKPRDMAAFRQRQEQRPDAIPVDIERQNGQSLQRSAEAAAEEGPAGEAGVPDVVRKVISKSGQSLPEDVREEMESKLGEDFADVQIHTGSEAAAAADALNARAFTVGNHVVFNEGEYNPETNDGKEILAHELTHVRQQNGEVSALPAGGGMEVDPDPQKEKEAEKVGKQVRRDDDTSVQRKGVEPGIQRSPAGTAAGSQSVQREEDSSGDSNDVTAETERVADVNTPGSSTGSGVSIRRMAANVSVASGDNGTRLRIQRAGDVDVDDEEFWDFLEDQREQLPWVVFDTKNGERYPIYAYPEQNRIDIPGCDADYADNYPSIGHLRYDLPSRYLVVDWTTEPMESDWERVAGDEATVWQYYPRDSAEYALYTGGDQAEIAVSIESLQAKLNEPLRLRAPPDEGEPTSLEVQLNDFHYEVVEKDGSYHAYLEQESLYVKTEERDKYELAYNLPNGSRVYDANATIEPYIDVNAGGVDNVPTIADLDDRSELYAIANNSSDVETLFERYDGSTEEPADDSVLIINANGELEEISLVAAAGIREDWAADLRRMFDSLIQAQSQFQEYLGEEYSVGNQDDMGFREWTRATVATLSEMASLESTGGGGGFDQSVINETMEHHANCLEAISRFPMDLQTLQEEVVQLQLGIEAIRAEFRRFMQANIEGAERMITALEVTQDVAKGIIGTIAKAKFGSKGEIVAETLFESATDIAEDASEAWINGEQARIEPQHMINFVVDLSVNFLDHYVGNALENTIGAALGKPSEGALDLMDNDLAGDWVDEWEGSVNGKLASLISEIFEEAFEVISGNIGEAVSESFDEWHNGDDSYGLSDFIDTLYDGVLEAFEEIFSVEFLIEVIIEWGMDEIFDAISEAIDNFGLRVEDTMDIAAIEEALEDGELEDLSDAGGITDDDHKFWSQVVEIGAENDLDGEMIEVIDVLQDVLEPLTDMVPDLVNG